MNRVTKSRRIRIAVVSAVAGAALTMGSGISAWSWMPQEAHPVLTQAAVGAPSYTERVNPDGTCDLVDAQGIPLHDSQFMERTGSSPCDQG